MTIDTTPLGTLLTGAQDNQPTNHIAVYNRRAQLADLAANLPALRQGEAEELGLLLQLADHRPWANTDGEVIADAPGMHESFTGLLCALNAFLVGIAYGTPQGKAKALAAMDDATAMLNSTDIEHRPWTVAELRDMAPHFELTDEEQARLDAADRVDPGGS